MKKIEFTKTQIKEIIKLYTEDMLGTLSIGKLYNTHKTIISRTLKENGIMLRAAGRRNLGGKVAAQKRYDSKPETKKKRNEYYKEWSKDNKEYLKKYSKQWNVDNREHVNEYKRNYERERRANDPKYRLGVRTRTAVYTCLKEANVTKYRSTFDILGYTLEELMVHLEGLFTKGMTWENYGEWHVDHKIPMCSFEFESIECDGFKECWTLSNLQPLWGSDNLEKGSKIL